MRTKSPRQSGDARNILFISPQMTPDRCTSFLFDAPGEIIFSNFDSSEAGHVRSRHENHIFPYAAFRVTPRSSAASAFYSRNGKGGSASPKTTAQNFAEVADIRVEAWAFASTSPVNSQLTTLNCLIGHSAETMYCSSFPSGMEYVLTSKVFF